jgi:methyltransferase family protein
MAILNTLAKALRNPKLVVFGVRRYVLIGGIHEDSECMNAVRSWSSGKLPHVPVHDLFPGIEKCGPIVLRRPQARVVGFSLDLLELVHVLSAVRFTGARSILEVGTFDGFTALNIAANMEGEGKIHTVDLPKQAHRNDSDNPYAPYRVGSQFQNEPEAAKIEQLWADSTTADWRLFGGPFDMILIDGSHVYRDVKSDSQNAFKHLRPGGVVFWHDYGHFAGVSKAVDELASDHPIAVIRGTRLACSREIPC